MNRVVAAVVLVAISWLALHYFTPAIQQFRILSWQRECMNFDFPRGGKIPLYKFAAWDNLESAIGVMQGGHPVFLHERHAPNGRKRLVVIYGNFFVTLHGVAELTSPTLEPMVILPGSLLRKPVQATSPNAQLTRMEMLGWITLLESQPDPNDRSHFTIVMENTLNQRFIIDGWLRDDDTVLLEPRPPLALPSSATTRQ